MAMEISSDSASNSHAPICSVQAAERDNGVGANNVPHNAASDLHKEMEDCKDNLEGDKPWKDMFKWNFFRTVLSHLCLSSLIGGAIIMALSEDLEYLDALFLAASALTGTGFAVVSMVNVNTKAFIMIFILMLMGSGLVIQLCALLFRM
jgi:hypothetical protein